MRNCKNRPQAGPVFICAVVAPGRSRLSVSRRSPHRFALFQSPSTPSIRAANRKTAGAALDLKKRAGRTGNERSLPKLRRMGEKERLEIVGHWVGRLSPNLLRPAPNRKRLEGGSTVIRETGGARRRGRSTQPVFTSNLSLNGSLPAHHATASSPLFVSFFLSRILSTRGCECGFFVSEPFQSPFGRGFVSPRHNLS